MTALQIWGTAEDTRAGTSDLVTVPTDSVTVRAKVDTTKWQATEGQVIIAQIFNNAGLYFTNGVTWPVSFWLSTINGFNLESPPSPWPFTDGLHWVAFELVFDDGSGDHTVEWMWSDDATDDPDVVSWTSLGGVITVSGTTNIPPTVQETSIGGSPLQVTEEAYYLVAQIQFDGVTVAQPAFMDEVAGTTAFTDVEGVDWTLFGTDIAIVEYPPPVPEIQLAGAARQANVNAPFMAQSAEDILNPLRARVLRPPFLDVIAEITSSRNDEAREQRNAPGSGSFQLLIDDPVAALIQKKDLIQQIIEGQVAFTQIVEEIDTVTLSTEEEAGEIVTYRGRSHLALLEWGIVYESRGIAIPPNQPIQRDRVFNWTAAEYDDSFWATSVAAGTADGPDRTWYGEQVGPPMNGPSVTGNTWRASTGDTQSMAPVGPVYLRNVITVPMTREYVIYWAVDNYGDLYVDGQLIDTAPSGSFSFLDCRIVPITLSAGDVQFAVRAVNGPLYDFGGTILPPGIGINPVGMFFVLATHTSAGEIDEIIAYGDSNWRALGRPANEPGMTPSQVARICLEEWQDRLVSPQEIPFIELTCTDEIDSAGQPWSETPNISTKVGNDYLTFFTEIAATYWEMRMRQATLQLDLYVKGTHIPSGVEYLPSPAGFMGNRTGNMRSLQTRMA